MISHEGVDRPQLDPPPTQLTIGVPHEATYISPREWYPIEPEQYDLG